MSESPSIDTPFEDRIMEVPEDGADNDQAEQQLQPIIREPGADDDVPVKISTDEIENYMRALEAEMTLATVEDDWEEASEDEKNIDNDDNDSDTYSVNYSFDETLSERLAALVDIVHPCYRDQISAVSGATSSIVTGAVSISTKAFWVLSTSMLLLGVPWALAYSEDQQLLEMEKEERMRMMGSDVLTQDGGMLSIDSLAGGQEIKATA